MKRRSLKERGITLVALVVTIIILLILAGVTISLVVGQGGLIQRAKNSTSVYNRSSDGEYLQQLRYSYEIDKENDEKLSLKDFLTKQDRIDKVEDNGDGTLNVTIGKNVYTIQDESSKKPLGRLIDVAKVGDYVNYSKTYENQFQGLKHTCFDENLGNGWRVAYVDKDSGVVTLISEGIPLQTTLDNSFGLYSKNIIISSTEINKFFDSNVANNINILDLEDIKLLCNQANIKMEYTEANFVSPQIYSCDSDSLKIIDIGTYYLLNTIDVERYGNNHYFFNNRGLKFENGDYEGIIGLRLVIGLKPNLEYYDGNGNKENPYKI